MAPSSAFYRNVYSEVSAVIAETGIQYLYPLFVAIYFIQCSSSKRDTMT